MNEVIRNLSSISWWFSVVIVGIIINLISIYLKAKLDKQLSSNSTWWRKRSQKIEKARLKRIEELRESEGEQRIAFLYIIAYLFWSLVLLILGLCCMILCSIHINLNSSTNLRMSYMIAATLLIAIAIPLADLARDIFQMLKSANRNTNKPSTKPKLSQCTDLKNK